MSERPRRFEIATTGFDEFLSLVGSDPFGGGAPHAVGLRVPFLPTPTLAAGGAQLRYLFLLASFSVAEGACVRIRGYRQLATLGLAQETVGGTRVIEQDITSPIWHPPDADISWHIRRIGDPNAGGVPKPLGNAAVLPAVGGPVLDVENYKRNWSDGSALLYGPGSGAAPGSIYPNIATYVPPNAGKPYGDAIDSKQGTFYDLRTSWRTHGAWNDSLDIPIRGPDTIAFFASVRQTNPETRLPITVASGAFYGGGLLPEEQFLLNFPTAQYWRVGGALIVEES